MQFIIDEDTCLGLSITFASDKVYFIKTDQDITVSYLSGQLSNLLANNYILSTINLKDQLDYLEITNDSRVYDMGIGAYLLNPLKSTYNFDDIARDYLNMTIQSRKELFGKKGLKEVINSSEDDFLIFACYESFVAFEAYDSIVEQLKKTDMYDLFVNIKCLLYTHCLI